MYKKIGIEESVLVLGLGSLRSPSGFVRSDTNRSESPMTSAHTWHEPVYSAKAFRTFHQSLLPSSGGNPAITDSMNVRMNVKQCSERGKCPQGCNSVVSQVAVNTFLTQCLLPCFSLSLTSLTLTWSGGSALWKVCGRSTGKCCPV